MKNRLVSLCAAVALLGCPEKKQEAPAPVKPVEKAAEVKAPPPPPVVEKRAEKECAAAIDPGPVTELKIGERNAKLSGARLTFSDADADGKLSFGVLGPINEDSGLNMVTLKKYVKFFTDEKVDAIVVTGDVGEVASGITRVLTELAGAKVPVLTIIGNGECRADYTDGVSAASKANSAVVNMNAVRVVEFPEATLVSLPGYHHADYIKCATGCQYLQSTIDEVGRVAKEAKSPVVLVAHGGPQGQGNAALDWVSSASNVGDPNVTKLMGAAPIPFGFFSNIKEAGGRAVADVAGTKLVKEGEASKTLYLNPGPADATTPWDMNDGSKGMGMAAVFTVKDGQGSYKMLRVKAPSAADKAEAKKLDPQPNKAAEEPKP